jgi:hypothetical protein
VNSPIPHYDMEMALKRIVQLVLDEERTAEEFKVTPEDDDLSVMIRKAIGTELFTQLQKGQSTDVRRIVEGLISDLSTAQRANILMIVKQGPRHRDQICPKRFVNASSCRALERLGLIRKRDFPVAGWQLSPTYGPIVVETLTAGQEEQS